MGGVGRNLVLFELEWHCTPDKVMAKIKERQTNDIQQNPRLARTVDGPDTVAPSRMETRIHTPGSRQPKMRWQQIGKTLGAGQFATVYKALDLDSGRTMAAKMMLRPPRAEGNRLWVILKRKVEILSRISHSHIVDYIFSQGWEEGKAEIFMGLKEGTLQSLVLRGCSLSARELADTVFNHMLQALDFLSAHGIIHRDLKPENILYMSHKDGYHFQLGDFGLSNRQALAATHAGSPVYMAPEFYHGGKQTSKADIWSLFVTTLWTLDTGGFRQLEEMFTDYHDVKKTVLSLANAPELFRVREMARVDAGMRASAAQMLVRCFDGAGLTTPRSQVPPIVDSLGDGPAPPPDPKGKAPAAVPDAGAAGRAPAADTESRLPKTENKDRAQTAIRAAKERPERLTRAVNPLGIAKNQPRAPRRGLLRQPNPVEALLKRSGPAAVTDTSTTAPPGRRPPDSQPTSVYQVPGAFPGT